MFTQKYNREKSVSKKFLLKQKGVFSISEVLQKDFLLFIFKISRPKSICTNDIFSDISTCCPINQFFHQDIERHRWIFLNPVFYFNFITII